MTNEKEGCPCSERRIETESPIATLGEIPPESLELLRGAAIPFEFKSAVGETVADIAMPSEIGMKEPPAFPAINTPPIEMPRSGNFVPPLEIPFASVSEPLPQTPVSYRCNQAVYLTDLTLDVSGVAHMTTGLFALSRSSLAPFVNNTLACWQDTGGAVAAQFTSTRIVTGYTMPQDKSTIESKEEVLTIKPEKLADKVQLRIGGQNRATIRIIKVDPKAGTVTFRVKGALATPANKRDGDTTVEAVVGGAVVAKTNLVVVIPKAIAKPHPTFNGTIKPVNRSLSTATSPALKPSQVAASDVGRVTVYITELTIAVNDQFGDRLDSIYKGAPVSEDGEAINQSMSDKGTYKDPVGPMAWPNKPPYVIPSQVPDPAKPGQTKPNPAIEAFLKGPKLPPPNKTKFPPQNVPVEVGGHSLNPAIVNRVVEFTPPDKLKITWP